MSEKYLKMSIDPKKSNLIINELLPVRVNLL